MKKSIITLMGLFTLIACSDDALQEAEQNGKPTFENQANSFNNDDSGFVGGPNGTKEPGLNYYSPWDIWYNRGKPNQQPSYNLSNGNVENISPYKLEVFAWIGLAYFDGNDDGVYNDPNLPIGSQMVADMAANPTLYPNLYPNGHEVGNLVRTAGPITLNPQDGIAMEDVNDHLPMNGSAALKYGSNSFNLGGVLAPAEDILIRNYGKVFFYEVNVFQGGAFVGTYFMHPEIPNLPNPSSAAYWEPIKKSGNPVQGNMPPLGSFDLYYINHPIATKTNWAANSSSGNQCDSHEVVFHVPANLHSQPIGNGKTLGMGFTHHPYTLWQNSFLTLGVY